MNKRCNNIKSLILILILTFLFIYCCSPATEKNDESKIGSEQIGANEIKDMIHQYDQLLAGAYITMDLTSMQELITPEHSARLNHRIQNIKKSNKQMKSALKNIEFDNIKFSGDQTVTVKTKELWDIQHIAIETQKVVKEHKGYRYELIYELVKREEGWLINAVDVLSEKATDQLIDK